jgi:hypothetical protein
MGAPDRFRARYREELGEVVQQVVYFGVPFAQAVEAIARRLAIRFCRTD